MTIRAIIASVVSAASISAFLFQTTSKVQLYCFESNLRPRLPQILCKPDSNSVDNDPNEVEEELVLIDEAQLILQWSQSGNSSNQFNLQKALLDFYGYDDDEADMMIISKSAISEESTLLLASAKSDQPTSSISTSSRLKARRLSSRQSYEHQLSKHVAPSQAMSSATTTPQKRLKTSSIKPTTTIVDSRHDLQVKASYPTETVSKLVSRSSATAAKFPSTVTTSSIPLKAAKIAPSSTRGRAVGIDLGTTFSAVSVTELGRPRIITVDGKRTVASVVAYLGDGQVLVGEPARNQQVVNPRNTFASVKRIIGRTIDQVISAGDKLSVLKVEKTGPGTNCTLRCPELERLMKPEELSAEVIKTLLRAAEAYIGEPITRAVVTVPAYFNPVQCSATERAGKLAGLEKVKLLREPEAAALAYGLTRQAPQIVLVFDLGGGTFDVSVLNVGGGLVEVIATSGDAHLGGDDFDAVLVNWLEEQFASEYGNEATRQLKGDPVASARVRDAAVSAKVKLSSMKEVVVEVPFIQGNKNMNYTMTRSKFESLCKPLLARLLRPVREVAVMAGVNLPGESGLLGLQDDSFSSEEEDDENSSYDSSLNEDSSVSSYGEVFVDASGNIDDSELERMKNFQLEGRRSVKARNKARGSTMRQVRALQRSTGDNTLSSFPGGQALNAVLLVGGATRMPAVQRLVRLMTGLQPCKSVNPDEAVSLGAAVMAGILDGQIQEMQVMSTWQAAVYRAMLEHKDAVQEMISASKLTAIPIPSNIPLTQSQSSRDQIIRDRGSTSDRKKESERDSGASSVRSLRRHKNSRE